MELNFGIMGTTGVERQIAASTPFRLAVLGDFSAAANRGRLETGDDLARRKPQRIDVDNFDKIIAKLNIVIALPLGEDGTVELQVGSLDDLHPDRIYENAEIFSALSDLRQRLSGKNFASAAKEIAAWPNAPALAPAALPRRSRGATVPRAGKLSDFAALIGQPSAPANAAETVVDDLLKSVVRRHIRLDNPQQAALTAAVDQALSTTMRKVLHHSDFQTLESLWRSVDFLVRRVETSTQLQIVLYDISAEELAADLSVTDSLEDTGLYKLLVEQPSLDAQQGAVSAIVGAYVFDQTPPQAELLGRMAKLSAIAKAPFISSISPDFLNTKPEDVHPLITEAWDALRSIDEARYLALVTPRYLIRQPYGARTDPIDSFDFEEFTPRSGLKGMLWANPAIVAALMLAQGFSKEGPAMNLGSILSADDIPYYVYIDEDGDSAALPCTERMMTERVAQRVTSEHFIPLLSIKGRPEIRLGGFLSLASSPLAGRWEEAAAAAAAKKEAPKPEMTGKTKGEKKKKAAPAAEEEAPAAVEQGEPGSGEQKGDESTGDAELDALLKGLDEPKEESASEEPAEAEGGDMDPELAAMLKQL